MDQFQKTSAYGPVPTDQDGVQEFSFDLQQPEVGFPLVADHFSTREAPDGDDHSLFIEGSAL
jgi:hypothetical protein